MKKSEMTPEKPAVSVVMSVYNGERWLREAVDSILNQTLRDLEFIIINDGSKDGTLEILKGYTDPRIRLVSRENRGLISSLNEGIDLARAEYVARMDCDDVSMPERLALEARYLDEHPEVSLVFARTRMAAPDHEYTTNPQFTDSTLPPILLEDNIFAHGSVMYRKSAVVAAGKYSHDFPSAEDRALWLQLAWSGHKFRVIDQPLYYYRIHPSQVCATMHPTQMRSKFKAQRGIVRQIRSNPRAYAWVDADVLCKSLVNRSIEWRRDREFAAAREAALALRALNRGDWTAYKLYAATLPGIVHVERLLRRRNGQG